MYDTVQEKHPKTLSGCWIIATYTSKHNVDILFRDMMEVVMESGYRRAQLNLKVLAYHCNRVSAARPSQSQLEDSAHAQAVVSQKTESSRRAHCFRTECATGTAHDPLQGPRLAR